MASDVFVTFCLALIFVSVIGCLSFIFKITNLIALGVPSKPILLILFYSLPTSIGMAIPLSLLVACLLVFGRLSADGEIVAMQTSGLSIWEIVSGTLLGAVGVCLACFYLLHEVDPLAHFARRQVTGELRNMAPMDVIEQGRFVRPLDGVTIFVGRKRGSRLEDIRIIDTREEGLRRELRARAGAIKAGERVGQGLTLELEDVRISPFSRELPKTAYLTRWLFEVPEFGRPTTYRPDEDDMTFRQLAEALRNVEAHYPQLSAENLAVQRMILAHALNHRSAMALSSLAFTLVGIPLGIRSRRRQSTVGIATALGLYAVFYYLTSLSGALTKVPDARPDLLAWVPVLLLSGIGVLLLRRIG